MYSDIYANGSYNRKLAKLTNIDVAVYWSELVDIIPKVVKKKTYNGDGYFPVDRAYIENRTSLDEESQYTCDEILQSLGVLDSNPEDHNQLKVRVEQMTAILIDETAPKLPTKVKAKRTSSASSKKAQCENMKRHIYDTDADLTVALRNWVDSVYANKKYLTFATIDLFIKNIKAVSDDCEVQLKIVELAQIHGYTDAQWAINLYNKDYKNNATKINQPQKIASGINEDLSF